MATDSSRRLALATSPERRRPLISLTPLIDVVFILLVFFMLASSFLDWRSIDLRAPGRAAAADVEGALFVEVRQDGLRLGGVATDLAALLRRARERVATVPGQRVVVRVAAGVPLQPAVSVLDALAAAGIANIALVGP